MNFTLRHLKNLAIVFRPFIYERNHPLLDLLHQPVAFGVGEIRLVYRGAGLGRVAILPLADDIREQADAS